MIITMKIGSLKVMGICLLMLAIGQWKCFQFEIDFRQGRPTIDIPKFNPFDQFLNLHDLAEEMMGDISDLNDETEANTLPKLPNSKKDEFTNKMKTTSGVQTQTYTIESGLGKIHVTEVHIGPANGRFKNLNPNKERVNPFVFFKDMDSMFDDFFDSLAQGVIQTNVRHVEKGVNMDNLGSMDLEDEEEEVDTGGVHTEKNNHEHEENFKVNEIKDITDQENAQKEAHKKISSRIDDKEKQQVIQIENEKSETKQNKNSPQEDIQIEDEKKSQKEDDQYSSISKTDLSSSSRSDQQIATTSASSTSNIVDELLTSKQKKKQIKDQKRKAVFAQVCKYVFYSIVIFTIYLLVKKVLEILGIKQNENSQPTVDDTPCTTTTVELPSVEMKSNNIKSE